MLIYCSHKYGNSEENKKMIEKKITELQMNDLDNTYISPLHCFGHLYDRLDYETGLQLCLDLLMVCDFVYVLSDVSEGVRREIELAEILDIPVVYESEN